MKNELYINGTKCDLPKGYSLPLKWQSNIFGDVSKIVGNKSATITLPYTPTNRSVFAVGEVPATDGARARQKLTARCVVDGVQIFADGYAVLLSASGDGYEVALTWGVIMNYDAFVGDDTTLNNITWWNFNGDPQVAQLYDADAFDNLNLPSVTQSQTSWRWLRYGTETTYISHANVSPVLPSVFMKWLLDNFQSHYGLTFDIPASRLGYYNYLLVLLTSARVVGEEETLQGVIKLSNTDYSQNTITNNARGILKPSTNYGGSIEFTIGCTIAVSKTLTAGQKFTIEWYNYRTGESVPNYSTTAVYDSGSGLWVATLQFDNYEVEAGDDFIILAVDEYGAPIYWLNESVNINIQSDDDAFVGDYMAIVPNLPALTPIELLKDFMLHAGLFAVNTNTPNTLKFVTAEQFATDVTQVLPDPISAANVSWQYGDFAQKNELLHTIDDGGNNEGKGILQVNDDTLELTNEMYKSPFGLMYSGSYLHLYEKDEDETDWKYIHPAERLAMYLPQYAAVNDNVSFAAVIANRLPFFQSIIYEPTIIKCTIHMTLIEVVNLDFARSVYINKFGRRYAVISIEMTAKDTFTFELIQIPA